MQTIGKYTDKLYDFLEDLEEKFCTLSLKFL